ncbi:hypothetical protein [Oryzomonas sagensis]|uniref:hypothetical protein n=1 Tax=Oryzomonas sagensis TaxID=2603857 RepID=UPI001FEA368F|nr:hypothetical protein [Oryzomonas sagensis]
MNMLVTGATGFVKHFPYKQLLPFPTSLMRIAGKLAGKSAAVNRLTGSLTVDSSKIRQELGWAPPFTMEEGLRETAEWYKQRVETKR